MKKSMIVMVVVICAVAATIVYAQMTKVPTPTPSEGRYILFQGKYKALVERKPQPVNPRGFLPPDWDSKVASVDVYDLFRLDTWSGKTWLFVSYTQLGKDGKAATTTRMWVPVQQGFPVRQK